MQKETKIIYKNSNPGCGCLTVIIQVLVIIALYKYLVE